MGTRLRVLLAGVGVALLAGCGADGGAPRVLNVFAAASLTDAFTAVGARFEADNPGVEVRLNSAGSSDLAQQIVNGAPADVFAAANESTMKTVADAGLVDGQPTVFATNVLQIATPPGNPKGVASFADLARPDVAVVVCAPQVPCGAATERIEQATGVALSPVSEEPDVRSVLGKVSTGDADAGLVYVTDVRSARGSVEGVSFPESDRAVNSYPIAALTDAPEPELARSFVELVTGEFGREALEDAGFGAP
ncbi:MAG TPA: molybdate ABC transporter substrate-binding protein [Pseudonocardia sp.]|uniref:molybdate ABC transporter substrate-binding protein n=1 Tax=Pseudonocardia sp. TaxID=60912 RepID=UPI002B4B086A|nr:molybdate ABC transporter substrate-binding protein [Pseudonocardia sp.]HLU59646.1 molybdate ABC transporter substrate-binding protein [Pseudonocardia sp.]